MRIARVVFLTVLIVALAAAARPAHAQADFGIRAGLWDGPDPFIGFDVLAPLGSNWFINPNVELVFGDHEDVAALSVDFHYDLEKGPPFFWVGAGPAVLFREFDRPFADDSETDFGLNLLAGVGTRTSSGLVPYLQGKVVIADDSRFAVAVGLRF